MKSFNPTELENNRLLHNVIYKTNTNSYKPWEPSIQLIFLMQYSLYLLITARGRISFRNISYSVPISTKTQSNKNIRSFYYYVRIWNILNSRHTHILNTIIPLKYKPDRCQAPLTTSHKQWRLSDLKLQIITMLILY